MISAQSARMIVNNEPIDIGVHRLSLIIDNAITSASSYGKTKLSLEDCCCKELWDGKSYPKVKEILTNLGYTFSTKVSQDSEDPYEYEVIHW